MNRFFYFNLFNNFLNYFLNYYLLFNFPYYSE